LSRRNLDFCGLKQTENINWMESDARGSFEAWPMKGTVVIVPRMLAILISIATILSQPRTVFATGPRPPLLSVQVVQAPDPMIAFGKAYVVYELLLTSFDSRPIELSKLRVVDADDRDTAFNFAGAALAAMVSPVGPDSGVASTSIGSGQVRLAYIWLSFTAADRVPRRIAHFLQCRVGAEPGEVYEIALPPITVGQSPPLSIGPPLRGGDWVAEGGPSNSSYHRRARMVGNGTVYFAQRFAIDYVKVAVDGRTYAGDRKKNANYLCYGSDVLAVADGKVVATKDGIPENTPDPIARAVEMTMDTVGGNFVALDIGYRRYALYGHLIPGSLKVKIGDAVKRGQVLGRLGNSGNSTEPHLHFQIADAPSFLLANGLPYVYDRVEVKPARILDAKSDPPVIQASGSAKGYLATMLLEHDLVVFPR
jgi:Peptidase family M23